MRGSYTDHLTHRSKLRDLRHSPVDMKERTSAVAIHVEATDSHVHAKRDTIADRPSSPRRRARPARHVPTLELPSLPWWLVISVRRASFASAEAGIATAASTSSTAGRGDRSRCNRESSTTSAVTGFIPTAIAISIPRKLHSRDSRGGKAGPQATRRGVVVIIIGRGSNRLLHRSRDKTHRRCRSWVELPSPQQAT